MFLHELGTYFVTRILNVRVLALWLLLTIASLLTSTDIPAQWLWHSLYCAIFILEFRLWDDLADIGHDRKHHPNRLLVITTHHAHFHIVHEILAIMLAGLIFTGMGTNRALGFLTLIIAFLAFYYIDSIASLKRSIRAAWVPIKYPLFILLLADDPASRLSLIAATSTYVVAILDEVRGTGSSVLIAALPLLLALVIAWLLIWQ